MRRLALSLACAASLWPAPRQYELRGRIAPPSKAAVSLFGATSPFHAEALADVQGRFRIRALLPGEYTVAVFIPGRGETRRTVEVGEGTADTKGRVAATILVEDPQLVSEQALQDRAQVSTRELSIPPRARHEYAQAQKKLARRDVAAAVAHLEKAVELAPQFSTAWNSLGTIAYQTREFAKAETDFRKALDLDASSFEPLVNLGGVLLTEGKFDEALKHNLAAVLRRPYDALANSQLGITYFAMGHLDLARKYLEIAKRIDPAHFSYPQLTLARIHLQRDQPAAAANELRDFLRLHPDSTEAERVRNMLAKLGK